jgi:hypothetical protein
MGALRLLIAIQECNNFYVAALRDRPVLGDDPIRYNTNSPIGHPRVAGQGEAGLDKKLRSGRGETGQNERRRVVHGYRVGGVSTTIVEAPRLLLLRRRSPLRRLSLGRSMTVHART